MREKIVNTSAFILLAVSISVNVWLLSERQQIQEMKAAIKENTQAVRKLETQATRLETLLTTHRSLTE